MWAFSILLIVAQFVALQLGVTVSAETWTMFFSLLGINGAYIVSQGIADAGKEKAKIEAAKNGLGTSPGVLEAKK